MLLAINDLMLDMLAAIARKDYVDAFCSFVDALK
jgi:hypothetical protein